MLSVLSVIVTAGIYKPSVARFGPIYMAWDNADTQEDDEGEAVVQGAAGRLVLLYLPTSSRLFQPD
jgi:hypothetical protein